MHGRFFRAAIRHNDFENSRHGLMESAHARKKQMQHPSRRLAPALAQLFPQIQVLNPKVPKEQNM